MNRHNSSISSSEPSRAPHRAAGIVALWVLAGLAMIDGVINLLFPYPGDPRKNDPDPVAMYFDYGRSMEARLRRITRNDPTKAAPITQAGWYSPLVSTTRQARPGAVPLTIYGMSHAMRLADALSAEAPGYLVRSVGAPGATLNWAYGAFLRDRGGRKSKVVVLAVMSSTLPMIVSPAPMDWNTSFALPYTADRFVLKEGRLAVMHPPYESYAEYADTLRDPAAWESANLRFAQIDPYYDPLLFRKSALDRSTIARLLRRAWAQRRDRAMRKEVRGPSGFIADSEPVLVARAIIADFAARARGEGVVPVIYAVDSKGYADDLYRAILPALKKHDVAYLSTHSVIDPADSGSYQPDSHFTDPAEKKIARAMAQVVDDALIRDRKQSASVHAHPGTVVFPALPSGVLARH